MLAAASPRGGHSTRALAWRAPGAKVSRGRPRSRNRPTRCPRHGRSAAVDALVERGAGRPQPLRHCRWLAARRHQAARAPARAAVANHGAAAGSCGSKARRRGAAAAAARRLLGLATSSHASPRNRNQRRGRPLATSTLPALPALPALLALPALPALLALPVRMVRLRLAARSARPLEGPLALQSLS